MNSMADAVANGVAAEHAPGAAHSWSDADASRSRELSRARTIHAALERLGLLDAGDARVGGDLRLALAGADDREGSTPAASAAALGALCALLEHGPWRSILVLLVGPNCAGAEAETFAPAVAATATAPALLVRYARRAYEEVEPPFFPHAAFAFQAGFWGYDTWRPAVARLCREAVPLVFTSYNAAEAEDDADALDGWALGGLWRWRPEPNPWRSLAREPRAAELPRALYENACVACYGGEAEAEAG